MFFYSKVEHFQRFWSDGKHKGFEVNDFFINSPVYVYQKCIISDSFVFECFNLIKFCI